MAAAKGLLEVRPSRKNDIFIRNARSVKHAKMGIQQPSQKWPTSRSYVHKSGSKMISNKKRSFY